MNRLIAAAALLPALLATGTLAQTVSEDVTKQLWCGTAMVLTFSEPPPGLSEAQLAEAQAFVDAATQLLAMAVQAHLDAGLTQEAADKAKADMVPVVTEQVVTGDGSTAQFTFDECVAILPGLEQPADPAASSASAP